jgi:hypothetical protein
MGDQGGEGGDGKLVADGSLRRSSSLRCSGWSRRHVVWKEIVMKFWTSLKMCEHVEPQMTYREMATMLEGHYNHEVHGGR